MNGGDVSAGTRTGGRCLAIWIWMLAALWLSAGPAADAGEGPPQRPPAQVVTAEVQKRELPAGAAFVGSVVALRTSTVGSLMEGKVVELAVNEGDAVEAGDPLARLRTEQLAIQMRAAKAELTIRRQEEMVLKEALPLEIDQARARSAASQAMLKMAEARWRRAKPLFGKQVISDAEMEAADQAMEAAQQKAVETNAALASVSRTETGKYAQAAARVLAQREEVRRLKDDIEQYTIRAPFAGYVTKEFTEVGQWLAQGGPVVEVIEIAKVDVEVQVPERYASQVRLGAEVAVVIEALPQQAKLQSGRVELIVPQVDVRSRTFPVKVRLENPAVSGGRLITPGMFARVQLPVGKSGKVLVVPKDALILGGRTPMVCLVEPTGKGGSSDGGVARRVPVELGSADADVIQVRGALQAGAQVVPEGNERVFTGDRVHIMGRYRPPK